MRGVVENSPVKYILLHPSTVQRLRKSLKSGRLPT